VADAQLGPHVVQFLIVDKLRPRKTILATAGTIRFLRNPVLSAVQLTFLRLTPVAPTRDVIHMCNQIDVRTQDLHM
jgi:hypothetical protein